MNTGFGIKNYCKIRNGKITLNDKVIFQDEDVAFNSFIRQAYKYFELSYPKFFKMDNLSKLAFLASSVLLQDEDIKDNTAMVLSNRASSLDTDRKHQNSINNPDDYFPSPAVFVYTLPNICIGEISIKNSIRGENAFFIFDVFNPAFLVQYNEMLIKEKKTDKIISGWVDVDGNAYDAFLYLVEKNTKLNHTEEILKNLYND